MKYISIFVILAGMHMHYTYTEPENVHVASMHSYAHYQNDESLINKITEYVTHVQEQLESQGTIQRPLTREFSQILENKRRKMTFDELREFLSFVATVYDLYLLGNHEQYNTLTCALLMRVSGPLALFVRSLVLHSLLRLDREISYWEFQEYHPIYYFFHKSPSKIFGSADQKKQVRNNLTYLRTIQKEHFRILGSLTTHVSQFNPDKSIDEQYAWLSQLLRCICRLSGDRADYPETRAPDALLTRMRSIMQMVGGHHGAISRAIARTHPDGHLGRNWVWYVGATFVASGLGSYLYTHRQELPEWGKNIKDNIKKLTIRPVEEFRDAFVKTESKEELQNLYTKTILDYKQLGSLNVDDQEIQQAAQKLDLSFLEQRVFTQFGQDFKKNNKGEYNLVKPGFIKKNAGYYLGMPLDPILQALAPTPHLVPLILLYLRVKEENLIRRNRIMFALMAFLPITVLTGAAGAGVHKMYQWFKRNSNFGMIKVAIKEIVDLLNVYGDAQPSDMHPEDYGKLMYFVYKLKKEKSQVPEKYIRPFTQDIYKLESTVLTAEQKMNVIAFMYRSYPFLTSTNNHN